MDLLSHSLWSYVLWHNDAQVAAAVAAGVLPDLIGVLPPAIAAGAKHRSLRAAFYCTNPPRWAARYKALMYPLTHSLVVSALAWVFVSLAFGAQWWLLAWPLHVFIDILSHPSNNTAPFLYPFSERRMHGVRWWDKRFVAVNAVLLLIVFLALTH